MWGAVGRWAKLTPCGVFPRWARRGEPSPPRVRRSLRGFQKEAEQQGLDVLLAVRGEAPGHTLTKQRAPWTLYYGTWQRVVQRFVGRLSLGKKVILCKWGHSAVCVRPRDWTTDIQWPLADSSWMSCPGLKHFHHNVVNSHSSSWYQTCYYVFFKYFYFRGFTSLYTYGQKSE